MLRLTCRYQKVDRVVEIPVDAPVQRLLDEVKRTYSLGTCTLIGVKAKSGKMVLDQSVATLILPKVVNVIGTIATEVARFREVDEVETKRALDNKLEEDHEQRVDYNRKMNLADLASQYDAKKFKLVEEFTESERLTYACYLAMAGDLETLTRQRGILGAPRGEKKKTKEGSSITGGIIGGGAGNDELVGACKAVSAGIAAGRNDCVHYIWERCPSSRPTTEDGENLFQYLLIATEYANFDMLQELLIEMKGKDEVSASRTMGQLFEASVKNGHILISKWLYEYATKNSLLYIDRDAGHMLTQALEKGWTVHFEWMMSLGFARFLRHNHLPSVIDAARKTSTLRIAAAHSPFRRTMISSSFQKYGLFSTQEEDNVVTTKEDLATPDDMVADVANRRAHKAMLWKLIPHVQATHLVEAFEHLLELRASTEEIMELDEQLFFNLVRYEAVAKILSTESLLNVCDYGHARILAALCSHLSSLREAEYASVMKTGGHIAWLLIPKKKEAEGKEKESKAEDEEEKKVAWIAEQRLFLSGQEMEEEISDELGACIDHLHQCMYHILKRLSSETMECVEHAVWTRTLESEYDYAARMRTRYARIELKASQQREEPPEVYVSRKRYHLEKNGEHVRQMETLEAFKARIRAIYDAQEKCRMVFEMMQVFFRARLLPCLDMTVLTPTMHRALLWALAHHHGNSRVNSIQKILETADEVLFTNRVLNGLVLSYCQSFPSEDTSSMETQRLIVAQQTPQALWESVFGLSVYKHPE